MTPVRDAPSVRAEQKSQEVLGAALEILERNGEWARVRGEDGYEGWVSLGALVLCNAEQAAVWLSGADGRAALALSGSVVTEAGTA
ncbi:MAG: SH3 domain-containing protein, partial [Gemmatimonadota bacterium]